MRILSGADGSEVWDSWTENAKLQAIAAVGDVDRDGFPDLVAGDEPFQPGRTRNYIYLLSGRDGSVLADYTPEIPDKNFGWDLEPIDLNGDGIFEILVSGAGDGGDPDRSNTDWPWRIDLISFAPPREPTVEELTEFRLSQQAGQSVLTWKAGLEGAALEKSPDLREWETVEDVLFDGFYIMPTTGGGAAYYRLRFTR